MMQLQIENLKKSFTHQQKRVPLFDGFSCDLEVAHLLALIGPSGSGKTTLLEMIAGLLLPDDGTISLQGRELLWEEKALRHYRRSLGVVFQSENLFPHYSILENVALPLRILHHQKSEQALTRAEEVLSQFGLKEHLKKKPKEISGGEAQRVAIARALAPRPQLLLLDEPTSALDPKRTQEILAMIATLKEESTPMILVTHEMRFARQVADHVLFLAQGKLIESTPAAEFFEHPATEEGYDFLSNILH